MGPDLTRPTWAHFWPAINKRQTRLWPGYFLTQYNEIIFDLKSKKLKNSGFLGEIFLTQTKDGCNPTQHRQQKLYLTRTHHYIKHNDLMDGPMTPDSFHYFLIQPLWDYLFWVPRVRGCRDYRFTKPLEIIINIVPILMLLQLKSALKSDAQFYLYLEPFPKSNEMKKFRFGDNYNLIKAYFSSTKIKVRDWI